MPPILLLPFHMSWPDFQCCFTIEKAVNKKLSEFEDFPFQSHVGKQFIA